MAVCTSREVKMTKGERNGVLLGIEGMFLRKCREVK